MIQCHNLLKFVKRFFIITKIIFSGFTIVRGKRKGDNMPLNCDNVKFGFVKENAQLSNGIIDTPYAFNSNLTKYAETHLNDCKKNSTIGLLARQQEKTNYYPKMVRKNMLKLSQQDSFVALDKEFKQVYNGLYPNTSKVRKQLIRKGSIVLDDVNPIKKDFSRNLIKHFGNLIENCQKLQRSVALNCSKLIK